MKEEIIDDIVNYVISNYGEIPEFGNNIQYYAFCRWIFIRPDNMSIDDTFQIFDNEIYPVVKKRIGISENNTL